MRPMLPVAMPATHSGIQAASGIGPPRARRQLPRRARLVGNVDQDVFASAQRLDGDHGRGPGKAGSVVNLPVPGQLGTHEDHDREQQEDRDYVPHLDKTPAEHSVPPSTAANILLQPRPQNLAGRPRRPTIGTTGRRQIRTLAEAKGKDDLEDASSWRARGNWGETDAGFAPCEHPGCATGMRQSDRRLGGQPCPEGRQRTPRGKLRGGS